MNSLLLVLCTVLATASAQSEVCACVKDTRASVKSNPCEITTGSVSKGQCFKDLRYRDHCYRRGRIYAYRKILYKNKLGWIADDQVILRRCPKNSPTVWKWKNGSCRQIRLVSRTDWRAQSAKSTKRLPLRVSKVFIHHTVTQSCTSKSSCSRIVQSIQKYHMNNLGWDDIGYNFLVGEDGRAYEGRGWSYVGAHTRGQNDDSIGIAVIGDFRDSAPSLAAKTAIENLIACGIANKGKLSSNYKMWGHRDADRGNASPGDALYAQIRRHPHYSIRRP